MTGAPVHIRHAGHDPVMVTDQLPAWAGRHEQPPVTDGPLGDALVAGLLPLLADQRGAWVGGRGADGPAAAPGRDDLRQVAVTLPAEDMDQYGRGHSDATLWPLYHDAVDRSVLHRGWERAYRRVNGRFAAAAAAAAAPGARVWIHGHRLQLMPGLLRRRRPDLRIGFSLHTPFPPAELFSRLPSRVELLAGLLGADLIGFQRQGGVRNLLRICNELFGLATDGGGTEVSGRRVGAIASSMGVDAAGLDRLARQSSVRQRAHDIRVQLGDPSRVLLAVDSLDTSQGTERRLTAFDGLLRAGDLRPDEVTLVQVVLPDPRPSTARRALRDRIEHLVGRINGDHARICGPVVHYLYQPHSLTDRAALYLAADVLVVTALREGMSLVAKEYVAARTDATGTLVLSELTGAAADLPDAVLTNPHDADALRAALLTSVRQPHRDAGAAMRRMRRAVHQHDVHHWADDFLARLSTSRDAFLESTR